MGNIAGENTDQTVERTTKAIDLYEATLYKLIEIHFKTSDELEQYRISVEMQNYNGSEPDIDDETLRKYKEVYLVAWMELNACRSKASRGKTDEYTVEDCIAAMQILEERFSGIREACNRPFTRK